MTLTNKLAADALDKVVLANDTTLTLANVADNALMLLNQTVGAGIDLLRRCCSRH